MYYYFQKNSNLISKTIELDIFILLLFSIKFKRNVSIKLILFSVNTNSYKLNKLNL